MVQDYKQESYQEAPELNGLLNQMHIQLSRELHLRHHHHRVLVHQAHLLQGIKL